MLSEPGQHCGHRGQCEAGSLSFQTARGTKALLVPHRLVNAIEVKPERMFKK
jgi:hypothetical protein